MIVLNALCKGQSCYGSARKRMLLPDRNLELNNLVSVFIYSSTFEAFEEQS